MAILAGRQIEVREYIIDPFMLFRNINAMRLVSKGGYERDHFGSFFSRNTANMEKEWICGVISIHVDRCKSLKEDALQDASPQAV